MNEWLKTDATPAIRNLKRRDNIIIEQLFFECFPLLKRLVGGATSNLNKRLAQFVSLMNFITLQASECLLVFEKHLVGSSRILKNKQK